MASWTRTGLVGMLAVGALAATTPAHASHAERRAIAEINELRIANGMRPLRYSRSLARSAERSATHILRVDRPHHDRRWISSRFRLTGEDIAWRRGPWRHPRGVVERWAASGRHRRVLLDERFAWAGVGREYGSLDGRRATVWVLHVGRK